MTARFWILLLVLVGFTAYTGVVVAGGSYFGFLELAQREPWGMQMLIDIAIAMVLFLVWMWRDARANRLPAWPYLLAVAATGSIGALAYLVHRELRLGRRAASDEAGFPARLAT